MADMAIAHGDGIEAAEIAYRAAKRRLQWRRRLLPAAGVLCALALWAALVYVLEVPPFIAPSPAAVAHTLAAKYDLLLRNLWPTALEAVLGFLLGNGMEPKIAIAALICFFPTLVNMVRGLESVNPQAMELMRVLSASQREIFVKLRIQNSLPYLFSALKIAASTAVIGAIVGEWIGSTVGIGALIIQATYNFDSALLYATVIVGSSFSVLFFLVITVAERMVVRWQAPVVA